MAAVDFITIGAHTRTHPILSRLTREKMEDEIIGGKHDLEKIIGRPVTQFAYPNGRWADINADTVAVAADHFDCAVITEPGCNPVEQNKYLLRRVGIGCNLLLNQFQTVVSGIYYLTQKPISSYEGVAGSSSCAPSSSSGAGGATSSATPSAGTAKAL